LASDKHGRAYLIRGPVSGPLELPEDADLIFEGPSAGYSLIGSRTANDARLGDINSDGVDDLHLVGNDLEVYFFYGCERP